MVITDAEPSDLSLLVDTFLSFYDEGHQDTLTVDYDNGPKLLGDMIKDPNYIVRMGVDPDTCNIIGFYIFGTETGFFKEVQAYMQYFYVLPRYRNGRFAIQLVKDMINKADDLQVKMFYAGSTAGINNVNEVAFTKLLSRYGFEALGTTLVRITSNE